MNFNNYIIIGELGQGGMAVVYRAIQKGLDRDVAIKVLNKEFIHNNNIRQRFLSEAKRLANFNHPNLVRVTDLIDEDDMVAFVMEHIDGETFKSYLSSKGSLNSTELNKLFGMILDGLGYVHDQQLVHRDIKLSNFMIRKSGEVKLLDFGIAKTMDETSEEYTQTGTGVAMGTPIYMSPEQVKSSKDIDYRSDIYSVGVMLWQMLSGKKLYDSSTLSKFEIQTKIVTEPLPLLGNEYDNIIQKCTRKKPEDRYSSCQEIKKDLSKILIAKERNNTQSTVTTSNDQDNTIVDQGMYASGKDQSKFDKNQPASNKVKKDKFYSRIRFLREINLLQIILSTLTLLTVSSISFSMSHEFRDHYFGKVIGVTILINFAVNFICTSLVFKKLLLLKHKSGHLLARITLGAILSFFIFFMEVDTKFEGKELLAFRVFVLSYVLVELILNFKTKTKIKYTLLDVSSKRLKQVKEWHTRNLSSQYAFVWINKIDFRITHKNEVKPKTSIVVLGMSLDGKKDILGFYTFEAEKKNIFDDVFVDLKSRGLEDILFLQSNKSPDLNISLDNYFSNEINLIHIVNVINSNLNFIDSKNRKRIGKDIISILQSSDHKQSDKALKNFISKWGSEYKPLLESLMTNWSELSLIMEYPVHLKQIILDFKVLEGFNQTLNKFTKDTVVFNDDDMFINAIYKTQKIMRSKWDKPEKGWIKIYEQLLVKFGNRLKINKLL